MDIDTYSRREKELEIAQRLIDAQRMRLEGVQGYTLEEFKEGMRLAVEQGAQRAKDKKTRNE